MIISAARDNAEAALGNGGGHGFGVGDHLFLVLRKARLSGFFEAHSFCGNGVDERAALEARESQLIEFFGKLRFAEDESSSRSTKSFVCGCADKIGMRHGAWMNACGDQSGDVSHVHEKDCAILAGSFGDSREIDN